MLHLVINLDRSPDRWASVNAQLAAHGILAQRVPGIDGRRLESAFVRRITPSLSHFSKTEFPRELSLGEIGCFLSHRKCWERLVESQEEWALIMEDDIIFSKRAASYIRSPDWIPEGLGLVQIFLFGRTWKAKVEKERIALPGGDELLRPLKPYPVGCQAYFISRQVAAQALEQTLRLTMPVDEFLFSPMSRFARRHPVWRLNPAVVTTAPFETTIGTTERWETPRSSPLARYHPVRHYWRARNSLYHLLFCAYENFTFK